MAERKELPEGTKDKNKTAKTPSDKTRVVSKDKTMAGENRTTKTNKTKLARRKESSFTDAIMAGEDKKTETKEVTTIITTTIIIGMKHTEEGGRGENEINTKWDEASKETAKKPQDITNRGEEDGDKPENTVKKEEKTRIQEKGGDNKAME